MRFIFIFNDRIVKFHLIASKKSKNVSAVGRNRTYAPRWNLISSQTP